MNRLIATAIAAFVLSGCGASLPTAPGVLADGELTVPDVLKPALAIIDADPSPVPILGEPAGAWLRRHVRGVRLDASLPAGVRAQCCGSDRVIQWSTGWLPDPTSAHDARIAAALLIHEARHAEGYRHTCADERRDRTLTEGGAWAVHAAWLRHAGDSATADAITASDIGCH